MGSRAPGMMEMLYPFIYHLTCYIVVEEHFVCRLPIVTLFLCCLDAILRSDTSIQFTYGMLCHHPLSITPQHSASGNGYLGHQVQAPDKHRRRRDLPR
jgi:hypothetical protein